MDMNITKGSQVFKKRRWSPKAYRSINTRRYVFSEMTQSKVSGAQAPLRPVMWPQTPLLTENIKSTRKDAYKNTNTTLLMKINRIQKEHVLLNKPLKSPKECQPAGNTALRGHGFISRECPFCTGTLESRVVKSCRDDRLSQTSTLEHGEGSLMNWSGSWSLQGLVPGLQLAASKALQGLLGGSNRNKAATGCSASLRLGRFRDNYFKCLSCCQVQLSKPLVSRVLNYHY